MKISDHTIAALGRIITGDESLSPYRSGPQLVALFNSFGTHDKYEEGFLSRWIYAENALRELNDTQNINNLICEVLDPRLFMDTRFSCEAACEYVNKRLKYDGFEVVIANGYPKIINHLHQSVSVNNPLENSTEEAHQFINEQIRKVEEKINCGDYDGAITNARSFLEAVLLFLEEKLCGESEQYDGDLPKLFKRVRKELNLDPSRQDIHDSLKQVITGFINIVNGFTCLSNRMGDRHVRSYKPSEHHAILIVNSVNTVVNFLFDTYAYQKEK